MIKILSQKKIKNFYLLILILVLGCAPLQERVRRFAGRSVHHFEKYRDRAISQYVVCKVDDCFEAILAIGMNQPGEPHLEKQFDVFQANANQGFIVFYNIPGQIDTTEVAVFLTSQQDGSNIEVVSLSSMAQEKVAKVVFDEIKASF